MVAYQIDGDRVQISMGRKLSPSLEPRKSATIPLEQPDENFLGQVLNELRRLARVDAPRSFRLRPKRSEHGAPDARTEASDELRPQGIARVGLGELLDEVTVGKALQVGHGVITSRYWENIWVCGLSVGGRLSIIEGGMGSEKCVEDEVRSGFKVYS